ncbi:MAG: helix-turn-helix domain-containing protein [Holosporaceae bacterium]|jgi:predicted XRE-type DNA-binding protein|nr:XRE family transcriptional regulator [Alphaproteobacteria bacterium]MCA3249317.1 XRE family transcriptional regulator [Rhodospirillaceae bacterium]
MTTDNDFELVRGSGNIYQDFGDADAGVRQAKAILAAEILKVLETEQLSTRQAETRSGVNHSEFVRIRRANLARFTIDRLISILGRLNQDVELTVTSRPRPSNLDGMQPHG